MFSDPLNGVSTLDLVLILRHILGIEQFAEPYQAIASDANDSKSITAFDLIELRKLILSIDLFLPAAPWKFVYEDLYASFPTSMVEVPQITAYSFLGIPGQTMYDGINFIVVKTGDVNLSYKTE